VLEEEASDRTHSCCGVRVAVDGGDDGSHQEGLDLEGEPLRVAGASGLAEVADQRADVAEGRLRGRADGARWVSRLLE